ncbi:MAG: hypothetical protein FWD17_01015 [Polyangiaceae bacterium]|nr:hypothetical protein [Polyangiaceae bacterium]
MGSDDAGADGASDASGVFRCPSEAGSEPSLSEVAVDGGVPLEDYVHAMAIARCNYFGRCAALAAYVVNECVESLTTSGTWVYWNCPSNADCGGRPLDYNQTTEPLVHGVDAGILQYDAQRAGQCVAALLAQGCAAEEPIENIAACAGVFACATGADAGSGGAVDGDVADVTDGGAADGDPADTPDGGAADGDPTDAIDDGSADGEAPDVADGGAADGNASDGGAAGDGAVDGGGAGGSTDAGGAAAAACAALLPPPSAPLPTCASDADCEYCVAGFCSSTQCNLADSRAQCSAYAQDGEPCTLNPLSVVAYRYYAEFAGVEVCAPGHVCAGLAMDGGAGTCVTPQDVGASCSSQDECKLGLACACGICQIPPSSGPCADGRCMAGIAYCDFGSNTCKPVVQEGESCPFLPSCGLGLSCSSPPPIGTCQPIGN